MRLIHTADWHLGKSLESFSRFSEQKEVLEEICEITERENADAVIIAGDLFDSFNPSTEAVELFFKTLKCLANNGKRAVIAIAGNHDSPNRIEAPDPLARECGIIFAGFPNTRPVPFSLANGIAITKSDDGFIELKLPDSSAPLRLLLTPYANEYRMKTFLGVEDVEVELRNVLAACWKELAKKYCDDKGVNILVAHLYMMQKGGEAQEEPDDEKPILHIGGAQAIYSENLPEQIQYAALGHLHRCQIIDTKPCPVGYSGSPIAYSFSETNQQKYVTLIEADPGKSVQSTKLPLSKGKKLLRSKFEDIDKAVEWLKQNSDSLVEITVVSETFLTAEERRSLNNAHSGIVNIVPEVRNTGMPQAGHYSSIDITKNIDQLFADYFKHKHGQEPNERLMSLFKEVLSAEVEP